MNTGLLDFPAPLFDVLDNAAAFVRIPALLRVVLYAAVCAWLGMRLYRRYSDQPRLLALRTQIVQSQRALALHEGAFGELRVLIARNLSLSLRQLGLTLRPALIASLPLLIILPWISNRFDYVHPMPGAETAICIQPATTAAGLHWIGPQVAAPGDPGCWRLAWPAAAATATLVDANGAVLFTLQSDIQSTFVHKFIWLNWLIGNPGGYLPGDSPIERIAIDLEHRELLDFGPAWLRDWETWFFATALVASLALKFRWQLQ
jgi:hypothetical protein